MSPPCVFIGRSSFRGEIWNPITFGEWLRQQRNQLRLTREEFADASGCSVSALRKIEDGERRPSAQIAELMANCLNIPPAERSTFVKVARGELSVDRLSPRIEAGRPPQPPPRINLPVLPTPLIGRQREVEELSQLLRDPQCRLLTLVGPGGIGKTRLAIETASQLQDAFADGVYFVPLASVNYRPFYRAGDRRCDRVCLSECQSCRSKNTAVQLSKGKAGASSHG